MKWPVERGEIEMLVGTSGIVLIPGCIIGGCLLVVGAVGIALAYAIKCLFY